MPPIIQNREVDPTVAAGDCDWETEVASESLQRCPNFGREFFDRLFAAFPEMKLELQFLRLLTSDDVYAVLDRSPGGLLVQIDPDLEYIVVCNDAGQGEYGDWGSGFDRIEEALRQVRAGLYRRT